MQGGKRAQPSFWGRLIYDLRKEMGLSQRQLAEQAQVNRSTLRRVEEGKAHGDVVMLEKLLGVLGYELEVLQLSNVEAWRFQHVAAADDPAYRSRAAAHYLLTVTPEMVPAGAEKFLIASRGTF